jgi:hypothetical protein
LKIFWDKTELKIFKGYKTNNNLMSDNKRTVKEIVKSMLGLTQKENEKTDLTPATTPQNKDEVKPTDSVEVNASKQTPKEDTKSNDVLIELASAIDVLTAKFSAIETQLNSSNEVAVKMSKQIEDIAKTPTGVAPANVPVQLDLSKMSTADRIIYNMRNMQTNSN